MRSVYIYQDEGVEEIPGGQIHSSIAQFIESHKMGRHYAIKEIDARRVIETDWTVDAALFIMPGGRDLPYVKKLNGTGNQKIKDFVMGGGRYLGICAGAYYGSHFCDFSRGDKILEVVEERELGFFSGPAIGPVLAEYVYHSEKGARVAHVFSQIDGQAYTCYFNGGCFFKDACQSSGVSVLATYTVIDLLQKLISYFFRSIAHLGIFIQLLEFFQSLLIKRQIKC